MSEESTVGKKGPCVQCHACREWYFPDWDLHFHGVAVEDLVDLKSEYNALLNEVIDLREKAKAECQDAQAL